MCAFQMLKEGVFPAVIIYSVLAMHEDFFFFYHNLSRIKYYNEKSSQLIFNT